MDLTSETKRRNRQFDHVARAPEEGRRKRHLAGSNTVQHGRLALALNRHPPDLLISNEGVEHHVRRGVELRPPLGQQHLVTLERVGSSRRTAPDEELSCSRGTTSLAELGESAELRALQVR